MACASATGWRRSPGIPGGISGGEDVGLGSLAGPVVGLGVRAAGLEGEQRADGELAVDRGEDPAGAVEPGRLVEGRPDLVVLGGLEVAVKPLVVGDGGV